MAYDSLTLRKSDLTEHQVFKAYKDQIVYPHKTPGTIDMMLKEFKLFNKILPRELYMEWISRWGFAFDRDGTIIKIPCKFAAYIGSADYPIGTLMIAEPFIVSNELSSKWYDEKSLKLDEIGLELEHSEYEYPTGDLKSTLELFGYIVQRDRVLYPFQKNMRFRKR